MASFALGNAKGGLKKLDDKCAITGRLKKTGDTIAALAQQADQRYDISGKPGIAMKMTTVATLQAKEVALRMAEESGLKRHFCAVGNAMKAHVAEPTAQLIRKHELDRRLQSAGKVQEHGYGAAILLRTMPMSYCAMPGTNLITFPPASCKSAQAKRKRRQGNLAPPSRRKSLA